MPKKFNLMKNNLVFKIDFGNFLKKIQAHNLFSRTIFIRHLRVYLYSTYYITYKNLFLRNFKNFFGDQVSKAVKKIKE